MFINPMVQGRREGRAQAFPPRMAQRDRGVFVYPMSWGRAEGKGGGEGVVYNLAGFKPTTIKGVQFGMVYIKYNLGCTIWQGFVKNNR